MSSNLSFKRYLANFDQTIIDDDSSIDSFLYSWWTQEKNPSGLEESDDMMKPNCQFDDDEHLQEDMPEIEPIHNKDSPTDDLTRIITVDGITINNKPIQDPLVRRTIYPNGGRIADFVTLNNYSTRSKKIDAPPRKRYKK